MKNFLLVFLFIFPASVFSQTAETFFRAGENKYLAKNYKEAVAEYSKAIRLDSSKVNYFVRRGFCFSLMEDYESAIEDYSHVVKLDPKHVWAYISRGGANIKIGAYKNAIRDFDMVISIDPKSSNAAEAYNNRGIVKQKLGDMDGACDDWKKSKKLGNPEAKIILENTHCK